MASHKIEKGLDLPIAGRPEQKITSTPEVRRVALMAADYIGMKPSMRVAVGDAVRRGQLLFEDKKTPGVRFTAPAAGVVAAINRGERRAFQSIVIELNESERSGQPTDADFRPFESYRNDKRTGELHNDQAHALLIESGLWTALRARPFGRVPRPEAEPHSIFITAMETDPLAASADVCLEGREADFLTGAQVVSTLTTGKTFICKAPGSKVPAPKGPNFQVEEFEGPHPSGLPGLHIQTLDPVGPNKEVWHLNYQDVVAVGRLFTTGRLDVERVISFAGPTVMSPCLIKTRLGASIDDLAAGRLEKVENRVLSGSVLSGRTAMGDVHGYLGRYALGVTALAEGREREFLGWAMPGAKKLSTTRAFLGGFLKQGLLKLTTTTNGSKRAMVPIGLYERVMPMDIMPTFLLRSLLAGDVERAEKLGCLELIEEDLALCTFVCPGKINYGSVLRENLTKIEKEG